MSDDMHRINKDEDRGLQLRKRDAETQIVLGLFVTILSLPVILGTLWATTPHARVVNIGAGLVLLGIGVIVFLLGFFNRKKLSGS